MTLEFPAISMIYLDYDFGALGTAHAGAYPWKEVRR